jgi:hypothetical protein
MATVARRERNGEHGGELQSTAEYSDSTENRRRLPCHEAIAEEVARGVAAGVDNKGERAASRIAEEGGVVNARKGPGDLNEPVSNAREKEERMFLDGGSLKSARAIHIVPRLRAHAAVCTGDDRSFPASAPLTCHVARPNSTLSKAVLCLWTEKELPAHQAMRTIQRAWDGEKARSEGGGEEDSARNECRVRAQLLSLSPLFHLHF